MPIFVSGSQGQSILSGSQLIVSGAGGNTAYGSGSLTLSGSQILSGTLELSGTSTALLVTGSSYLGSNCGEDIVKINAQLTMSCGGIVVDDSKLYFGTGSYIVNSGQDKSRLIISGTSAGIEISGAIFASKIEAGSPANANSYVVLNASNQLVLTASSGTGGGGTTNAGGSNTQIQYNDGGTAFGGISKFTWDDTDLKIGDDTKLKFGDGSDASIEYDENGRDRLIISGSTKGMELSGAVLIGIPPARSGFGGGFSVQEDGATGRIYLHTQGASGQESTTFPTNLQLKDDVILYLGNSGNALVEYDADGFDQLRISGSTAGTAISGTVSIGVPDARTPGFRVADEQQNNLFFYTQGTAGQEATVFSSSLLLKDNTNLYYGEQGYALMKYDQQNRSRLIISGSTAGTEISGTVLIGVPDARTPGLRVASSDDESRIFFYTQGVSGQESTVFPTNLQLKDDVILYLGDSGETLIEYDENGHNNLRISGSSAAIGVAISGAVSIGVPETRTPGFRVADEQANKTFFYTAGATSGQESTIFPTTLQLSDDVKLYLGDQGNALLEYDEDGRDRLIISGSTAGTEISGTVFVGVPEGRAVGFRVAHAEEDRIYFFTQGTSGQQATVFPTDLQLKSNVKLNLGDAANASIEYDTDSGHDRLAISGSAQGTEITGNIYISDHEHAGQSPLAEFDVADGIVEIRANRGQSSRVRITGSVKITGSANVSDYLIVESANRTKNGGDVPLVVTEAGVGIGQTSPKTYLDIAHNPTAYLADDTGGGEVVYFGTGSSLTAGKVYFLNSNGGWTPAWAYQTGTDAGVNAAGGNDRLLGISIGTTMPDNGMLVRGWFDMTSYHSGGFLGGKAVYIAGDVNSAAAGFTTSSAPSVSNNFVRIVGYATPTANVIYFDPSKDWVEVS